jgi:hypothetical protein
MYGITCDVWKVGNIFGELGRSSVTVECCSSTSVIVYRPSYRGINFATRFSPFDLYYFLLWRVDNLTREPTVKGNCSVRCLFA